MCTTPVNRFRFERDNEVDTMEKEVDTIKKEEEVFDVHAS